MALLGLAQLGVNGHAINEGFTRKPPTTAIMTTMITSKNTNGDRKRENPITTAITIKSVVKDNKKQLR